MIGAFCGEFSVVDRRQDCESNDLMSTISF